MQTGVAAETAAGETRVAVIPVTAWKLIAQGHAMCVPSGAGCKAAMTAAEECGA